MNYLYQNLKYYRNKTKLTQSQVANKLGITRSAYSYYETGKTEPSLDSIYIISKIFKISIETLISKKNNY